MRRVVAGLLAAAIALIAGTGTAGGRDPLHGLVFQGRTVSLVALEPATLAQRGRLLPLGRAQGSVSADTLGTRLAVASAGSGIVVVDTRRMLVTWRLPRGRLVRAVAWLAPDRLLVAEHGGVLLLDPVRKRVVARGDYDGVVSGFARWSEGLVLLTRRNEGEINPARLVVVGPGARTRTVELDRIAAGWASGPTAQTPFSRAEPGLAVDPALGRAFVVGGTQIASVDLSTLSVSHSGAERTLQKLATGPRRSAAWLGDGVLAVSGADERLVDGLPTSQPFGLRLVTGHGVRVIEEQATAVREGGGLALAYGVRYREGRGAGIGLAAYDRQGALRWRLFGEAPVADVKVGNGLAYVWAGGRWNVVELATGAVIGSPPHRRGLLLLIP